jgi:hypothetical protein
MTKAGQLVCGRCDAVIPISNSDRLFSQDDVGRPEGCGRTKYLRTWRRARDAGDPGATEDGRARLLTKEAYERHRPRTTRKPKAPPVPKTKVAPSDPIEVVLGKLGLVERRSA